VNVPKGVIWSRYAPFFTADDFTCRCGCGLNNMQPECLDRLLCARRATSFPFVIKSGTRCAGHNIAEGGAPTSDHLVGRGVDIQCTSSAARWTILNAVICAGFDRIGIGRTFIHAGWNRANPCPVVWLY